MNVRQLAAVAAVALAQGLVLTGTATADETTVRVEQGELLFEAAARQANQVSVSVLDGRFVVSDVVPVSPGVGCAPVSPTEVSCSASGVSSARILTADLNDSVMTTAPLKFAVFGGTGDDTLTGGAEADTFYGGDGSDTISGGAGPDTLYGMDGTDYLTGGTGKDHIDGGHVEPEFMRDMVRYDDRVAGVVVDLSQTQPTGGEPGEADTLVNIQDVRGGSGHDTLIGNKVANLMNGGPGADTVHGGDGADSINGEEGADWLYGGDGNDGIYGGPDNDHLFGEGHTTVPPGDVCYDTLGVNVFATCES